MSYSIHGKMPIVLYKKNSALEDREHVKPPKYKFSSWPSIISVVRLSSVNFVYIKDNFFLLHNEQGQFSAVVLSKEIFRYNFFLLFLREMKAISTLEILLLNSFIWIVLVSFIHRWKGSWTFPFYM